MKYNILEKEQSYNFDPFRLIINFIPDINFKKNSYLRDCVIKVNNNKVIINKSIPLSLKLLILKIKEGDVFNGDLKISFNQTKVFNLKFKNEIFKFIYSDLIELVSWLKLNSNHKLYDFVLNYVSNSLNVDSKKLNKKIKSSYKKHKRSTIFEIKDNSFYYEKNILKNELLIDEDFLNATKSFISLNSLEVEKDVNFDELRKHLIHANNCLQVLFANKKMFNDLKNKEINLRIRKIRRTKKNGFYLKHENVILVDPRNMEALYHELSHWLLENVTEETKEYVQVKLLSSVLDKKLTKKNKFYNDELLADILTECFFD